MVRFARLIYTTRPRLLADLRSAPPAATSQACLACHASWYRTSRTCISRANRGDWHGRRTCAKVTGDPKGGRGRLISQLGLLPLTVPRSTAC
jgi:hypothetical protein